MLDVSLFKIGLEIINIFKKIVIFIMRSKMKIVVIVMSIIDFFKNFLFKSKVSGNFLWNLSIPLQNYFYVSKNYL